jgi:UrcA family protein
VKTIATTFIAASICLTANAASAATTTTVRAAIDPDAVSVVVRYNELDLTREDGARVLLGRIGQAAKTVCGPEPARISLFMYQAYRGCVVQSAGAAVQQLNAPLVTALYELGEKPVVMAAR